MDYSTKIGIILAVIGIVISLIGIIISIKIYTNQLAIEERELSYRISILDINKIGNYKLKQYLDNLVHIIECQRKMIRYKRPLEYLLILRGFNLYIMQEVGRSIMFNNFVELDDTKFIKEIDDTTKKLFTICQQIIMKNHNVITNEVTFSVMKYKSKSLVRDVHEYAYIAQQIKNIEDKDTILKLDRYCFSYLFEPKTNTVAKKLLRKLLIYSDRIHHSYFIVNK